MQPYIALLAVLAACSLVAWSVQLRAARYFLLAFQCLCMGVLTAFRGLSVGTDNQLYSDYFTWRQQEGSTYCPVEFGYCALNRILADNGFSFQTMFIIESVVLYFGLFAFVTTFLDDQLWNNVPLLFFALQPFFNALNISRQYFALGIAMLALACFYKRFYIASIALCIAAVSVHYTVVSLLLLAVLLPLLHSSKSKWVIVISYVCSMAIRIIGPEKIMAIFIQLIPKYSNYATGTQFDASGSIQYILFTVFIPNIIFITALLLEQSSVTNSRPSQQSMPYLASNKNSLLLLMKAGALAYVVMLNAFVGSMSLSRFADFFVVFLISYFLMTLHDVEDARVGLVVLLVTCTLALISCYYFIVVKGYQSVIPYVFAS